MTLKEIRKQFIKQSGRYDLGIQDSLGNFTDNGADYYINTGLRYLSGLIDLPSANKIVTTTLPAGQKYLEVTSLLKVTNLMFKNSDDEWYPIPYGKKHLFFNTYPDALDLTTESVDDGLEYYTIINALEATSTFTSKIILFNCSPEVDTKIRYECLLIDNLTSETAVNYFTVYYPELVVYCALYQLEAGYRNTEGMRDWETAIMKIINSIDNHTVNQDLSDEMVMEL